LNSFSTGKSHGPISRFGGPWPNGGLRVHGGPQAAARPELTEEGHAGVPVHGTSPWRLGEQEEETGILTEVFDGWCGDGGRPAAGPGGGGTKSSKERH
jgi:hypothetical protein